MTWEARRDAVRAALERGDAGAALALYDALLAGDGGPRLYKLGAAVREAAGAELRPIRLRALRSYTVEPVLEAVAARALVDRLDVRAEPGGYGLLEHQLFGLSVDERCDAVLLATRLAELMPPLGRGFVELGEGAAELAAGVVDRVTGWLPELRRAHPRARVVVLGFAAPSPPAYGLADPAVNPGHRQTVARINRDIAAAVAATPGAVFVDVDAALSAVGYDNAIDRRTDVLAAQPLSPRGVDALAENLARVLGAAFTPRRKCLVVDCDNTLWGGVVGEDGIDGIELGSGYPGAAYAELQRAIGDLARRGVILAIASKNNEADVLDVLDNHPAQVLRRDIFSSIRVNWRDKVSNLREIAAELGIGADSLVLFDDSDFECALVRARMPEVLVVQAPAEPLDLAPAIDRLRCFDALSVSDEDRARGPMYRAGVDRARARIESESLDAFLGSLDLRLTIAATGPAHIERAAQLSQRTNQLNATTRRYSPADIERLAAADDAEVFHLRLADRFGDYGVCGLAITRRDGDAVEIDTLLLSCRVIGRGVEDALVTFLERRARDAGAAELRASYLATAKNAPVADLFDRLGFERTRETASEVRYRRILQEVRDYPPWFTMEVPP